MTKEEQIVNLKSKMNKKYNKFPLELGNKITKRLKLFKGKLQMSY